MSWKNVESWKNVCWGSGGYRPCTPSSRQRLRSGIVVWMHVFAWMVDIVNTNFEPLTFCCDLFVSPILVSVNVIDINMCKVLILVWNVLLLCLRLSHIMHYDSIITNVWWQIFTPITLALSCEVVHEKLWKSFNICNSYSKKISGTFFWTRCRMLQISWNLNW